MGSKTHHKDVLSNPKPTEINGTVIYGAEAHYSAISGLFGLFGAVEHVYQLLQSWPPWEETPRAG